MAALPPEQATKLLRMWHEVVAAEEEGDCLHARKAALEALRGSLSTRLAALRQRSLDAAGVLEERRREEVAVRARLRRCASAAGPRELQCLTLPEDASPSAGPGAAP